MSPRAQLAVGAMTVALIGLVAVATYSSGREPIAGVLGAMAALRAWLLFRQWRAGRQPHRTNKR